jgi:hypothetical protein
MLGQRVGYSEIRAVKADPNGALKSVAVINTAALAFSMAMV